MSGTRSCPIVLGVSFRVIAYVLECRVHSFCGVMTSRMFPATDVPYQSPYHEFNRIKISAPTSHDKPIEDVEDGKSKISTSTHQNGYLISQNSLMLSSCQSCSRHVISINFRYLGCTVTRFLDKPYTP